jgi:ionotropic glutamate receptor
MDLWETGLPRHWVRNFVPQAPNKCLAKKNLKEKSVRRGAIRLDDLMGAFLILGVGVGLATLAFVLEKIIYFRSQRKTGSESNN